MAKICLWNYVTNKMRKYEYTFYVLLTLHPVMILGKWPKWRTNSFLCIYFYFNSLHVSSTSCSSTGETNCVNTTSGSCRWPYRVHTTRPLTQSDSYQRLYWHNLSLLMISTMCWKHVESWNKNKRIEKNCASRWSFTKNHEYTCNLGVKEYSQLIHIFWKL